MWKPIEIYKRSFDFDDNGNHVGTDELFHSCKAEINCTGGKEYYSAKQINAENETSFKIRFCAKLKTLTPQEYFIKFGGGEYDIVFIDNYMMGNEFLKIKAVLKV